MTTTTPGLAAPAGAIEVAEWRLDGGTARTFAGTERLTETQFGKDVHVDIIGTQYLDGVIERYIVISEDGLLCAAEARHLAANLFAAADELDRLRG
jgi:hypothetical protein